MFDAMTGPKIIGGFCGTFLIFLLAKWGAETIYHVGPAGHGGEHAQAYTIPVEETGGGAAAEEVDVAAIMVLGDATKGATVFAAQCQSCHAVDGRDLTGPHLNALADREIGKVAGYAYSGAMGGHGGIWDDEALYHFLKSPARFVPGTKMGFAGLRRDQDLADVVAFLKTKE